MGTMQKLKREFVNLGILMVYFLVWLGFLVLLKYLLLAQYSIKATDFSLAVVGALVLAKVILVLEYVPLGNWVRSRAAWVDVLLRTVLYSFGVFIVMLLEKAFEARNEYGGFTEALIGIFHHKDIYHVSLVLLCLTAAILSYNIISVLHKHLGRGVLLRMLLSPLPETPDENNV